MNKDYFLERVGIKRPTAFDEYSYELLPENFLATDKIQIVCKAHGLFWQQASAHAFGTGCPHCSFCKTGERTRLTTEQFIAKSKKLFGDKYDYSKTKYCAKSTILTIICPKHGDFTTTPQNHYNSAYGCQKCDYETPRFIKKELYIKKARNVHGDKYDYSRVEYNNSTDKVEIICPTHGSFWQSMDMHVLRETDCPICARDNSRLKLSSFVERSTAIHGDRYDYSNVMFTKTSDNVRIWCRTHGEFKQRVASHLQGNGCRKCFLDKCKLSTESFIRNAKIIHGDRYDYSRVDYRGNKSKVEIICPTHGSFWQKPNSHISAKNGCRLCYESKGERAIEQILLKNGYAHTREYRIESHLYRYDFYLPELNLLIEFHGQQHYQPIELFGGEREFKETQRRDSKKRKLAIENGFGLIVLNYRDMNSLEKILLRKIEAHSKK